MAQASVHFTLGVWERVTERESVGLVGETDLGVADLLITSEAPAELLNLELLLIDRKTAIETFVDFEEHIPRVVRREFVSRLGGSLPSY